ncbi:phospholipid-transporting ATPase 1-like [Miscanthus floridulus]|uniref:phospholipid-transporting ATPase 1-like n=1 Tax=Miscanthus floridulus TaxID=154761 RepID=UPI0034592644
MMEVGEEEVDSTPPGVAYVQTINLDGESNLKTRYAKQETMPTLAEALAGVIKCERPNRNLYGFLTTVDLDGRRAVSLGPSNIMLRGCEVKNTAWAIGVAIYTGRDTKVMLNSYGAPSKRSRLETHMNRETIMLAVVLFLLCGIVSLLADIWLGDHGDELGVIPPSSARGTFPSRTTRTPRTTGTGWAPRWPSPS